ncbi:hypothetical protein GLYMA_01G211150v4 [Glycine max]|nr:hypothetical protein GLYMA_01G211150v4 [Glycine max]KAH1164183.1 hypothetical protein GYH30_002287 [Glycine max]
MFIFFVVSILWRIPGTNMSWLDTIVFILLMQPCQNNKNTILHWCKHSKLKISLFFNVFQHPLVPQIDVLLEC